MLSSIRQKSFAVCESISQYGDLIEARLQIENAKDWSDAELERCLGPCVCGSQMVKIARVMREIASLFDEARA